MKERLKKLGSLNLGKELTKNEQKKVTGGGNCYTVCSGGTYWGFCQAAYCAAAGHGTFQGCTGDCGGGA